MYALLCFQTLEFGKLGNSPPELLVGTEFGGKKSSEALFSDVETDDLRADTSYIDVIVFDTLMSGINIVTHRSANTSLLIGGDASSHTRAAHQNSPLRLPLEHSPAYQLGNIREVDRLRTVRSAILYFVSLVLQKMDHCAFERISCVIAAYCNGQSLHRMIQCEKTIWIQGELRLIFISGLTWPFSGWYNNRRSQNQKCLGMGAGPWYTRLIPQSMSEGKSGS
jgi:hypothetical protein